MKIKDLEKLVGTWDIYGNVADEIAIAFVKDKKEFLTEEGKKHYKSILNTKIEIMTNNIIIVDTNSLMTEHQRKNTEKYHFDNCEGYPPKIKLLNDLFWSYAGYTSTEEYNKIFK